MAAKPKRGPKPNRRPRVERAAAAAEAPAKLTGEERREFARLAAALRERGTLGLADVEILVATARLIVVLDRIFERLNTEDLVALASNDTEYAHPLLSAVNSMTMRLRGLLNDLGLTPAGKRAGKVEASGPAEEDAWSKALAVVG